MFYEWDAKYEKPKYRSSTLAPTQDNFTTTNKKSLSKEMKAYFLTLRLFSEEEAEGIS